MSESEDKSFLGCRMGEALCCSRCDGDVLVDIVMDV